MTSTRVILVRHGEAKCNVEGVLGGSKGCRGLTGVGIAQVGQLRDRWRVSGEVASATALYASVLPRAVETAEILHSSLGSCVEIHQDAGLRELDPGDADGLTWAEFTERYAEPNWDVDPTHRIAPGGESWLEFVGRSSAAVERVADAHPGEVVVIACHAGVVEASMLRFLPIPRERLYLRTTHASFTVWERGSRSWVLHAYNVPARVGYDAG